MKRTDLLKRVKKLAKAADLAFELEREGGNHSIYTIEDRLIPVPRHNEINELTAQGIIKSVKDVIDEYTSKTEEEPEIGPTEGSS